jgi:hypothetical protein
MLYGLLPFDDLIGDWASNEARVSPFGTEVCRDVLRRFPGGWLTFYQQALSQHSSAQPIEPSIFHEHGGRCTRTLRAAALGPRAVQIYQPKNTHGPSVKITGRYERVGSSDANLAAD